MLRPLIESIIRDILTGSTPEVAQATGPDIAGSFIGEYCICRAYKAGVHAGTVEAVSPAADGTLIVRLANSRRLWSWTAKEGVALSGVAQHGLKDGKIDASNPLMVVGEVSEIIVCSAAARASIEAAR